MQDKWDMLAERFRHVTDGIGKHIDRPIFETVVALNALDIPTVMSCGGHIDDGRGLLLPWVDIESTDPKLAEFREQISEIQKEVEPLQLVVTRLKERGADRQEVKAAQARADEKYIAIRTIEHQIRTLQAEVRNRLAHYLTQFYTDRNVPFDRRLILNGHNRTRLQNQGALDFYLSAPEEVQRQKLAEYREEMDIFTTFLKQIYFGKVLIQAS